MADQPFASGEFSPNAHSQAHHTSQHNGRFKPRMAADGGAANEQSQPHPLSESLPPPSAPPSSVPLPVAPAVLDQLNIQVDNERAGAIAHGRHTLWAEIGRELWRWRIGRGYTRRMVAATLVCTPEDLLALENGLSLPLPPLAPDPLSVAQDARHLALLVALLKHEALTPPLVAQIHKYLNF